MVVGRDIRYGLQEARGGYRRRSPAPMDPYISNDHRESRLGSDANYGFYFWRRFGKVSSGGGEGRPPESERLWGLVKGVGIFLLDIYLWDPSIILNCKKLSGPHHCLSSFSITIDLKFRRLHLPLSPFQKPPPWPPSATNPCHHYLKIRLKTGSEILESRNIYEIPQNRI
ncbi:hypothetical protein HanRHA438_Chr03g0146671 [Helianthus annuus]|nr:hypothetical protein HanRHA438_Chr03g0146671 [Helianthus annuus]